MILTQNSGMIMGPITKLLGFIFNAIYNLFYGMGVESIALSIVVFTIIVRLLLFPFNIKQTRSSKIQQYLKDDFQKITKKYKGKKDQESMLAQQKETRELQEKYGNNRQKLQEEMNNGAVCWLRNLDRKPWSLCIPYEINGVAAPMYPDLVVVRADSGGYVFDVLEPHDSSRKDNFPKAVGLAKFAEKHWDKYGRIELIRQMRGPDGHLHFYRLDMAKASVRNRVRGISGNAELDRIFEEDAVRED